MKNKAQIQFILVRPRNPLNIGACARALTNFGFERMSLVQPFGPVWREAKSAIGAEVLLKKAHVYAGIPAAIKRVHWVVGTSALQRRKKDRRELDPEEFKAQLKRKQEKGEGVALLFGPEKSGLTNEELDHCDRILRLPTQPKQPSMNLSHSVAVIAYLSALLINKKSKPKIKGNKLNRGQLEHLVRQALDSTEASRVFPGWNKKKKEQVFRRSFNRWELSDADAALLFGIFRWMKRKSKPSNG